MAEEAADDRRDRRRQRRLTSAGLRAVAAEPRAEVHYQRLEVADRPVPVAVPYLSLDLDGATEARSRGVSDALGIRLRFSDQALHRALSPGAPLERIIFDIAEQFRCESLVDPTWRGVRTNIAAAFDEWSESARGARIDETGIGLLVFTISHMLRYRLLRIAAPEAVDDIIETTRGNLARLVGHALRVLPTVTGSQEAFAEPAKEIARLIAELAADAAELDGDSPAVVLDQQLEIPAAWDLEDELGRQASDGAETDIGEEYRVYTSRFDVTVSGSELYRPDVLRRLRVELDASVRAQAVSLSRLAQRLQRLFPSWREDGWRGGEIDGLLDPARLAHIVVDPLDPEIRRQPFARPTSEAVVTFLIDTSGSMKLQRYETVAVVVDTLARALELAGASCEVLGFTTASWTGGRAARQWRRNGAPPEPGRLAELQHVVYKPADLSWRQARLSMAAMLRTDHYREGVDGEAVLWAHHRLMQRPERRRLLVLVSDGYPMEAATATANGDEYLYGHLHDVARRIDIGGSGVALAAVSLEQDLSPAVANSLTIDLDTTITIGTYDLLNDLFG